MLNITDVAHAIARKLSGSPEVVEQILEEDRAKTLAERKALLEELATLRTAQSEELSRLRAARDDQYRLVTAAREAVRRAEQSHQDADHRLTRASCRFDQQVRQLEGALIATADPRISQLMRELELTENAILREPISTLASAMPERDWTGKPLQPFPTNAQEIAARLDAVRTARARAERLLLSAEAPEPLEHSMRSIRELVGLEAFRPMEVRA